MKNLLWKALSIGATSTIVIYVCYEIFIRLEIHQNSSFIIVFLSVNLILTIHFLIFLYQDHKKEEPQKTSLKIFYALILLVIALIVGTIAGTFIAIFTSGLGGGDFECLGVPRYC